MKEALLEAAYEVARENFRAAESATFQTLDAQFGDVGFDAVLHAAQRAMQMHIMAVDLGERIWSGMLSNDKAEQILEQKFHEFPATTRARALADAYRDSR